ncbi:MAG: hypothetical protein DRN12_00280 [Thermoplasmata archaeon]|nr:MAG: hypothetical protein DRN12_00280 [Thermoplasmata archaeon]HEC89838.1 hypothetical protein [Thermoplasmatales archaeon]
MDDEILDINETSRMFVGDLSDFSYEEALAVEIMHRFNIDRETIETMPAFNETLKNILSSRGD